MLAGEKKLLANVSDGKRTMYTLRRIHTRIHTWRKIDDVFLPESLKVGRLHKPQFM